MTAPPVPPAPFQQLDHRTTAMGDISLRRRHDPSLGLDVFEAKLDDEFLMSSLFTVAEEALADLGLAAVAGDGLDVVVGGLGLGYTAHAALAHHRVRSVHVVEALEPVIDWHRRGLLPLSTEITGDDRCHLHHGDLFALVRSEDGFGPSVPGRVHALLIDIDHSPRLVLHPSHADLYTPTGLRRAGDLLHAEGVLALWSDEPPDPGFLASLDAVFSRVEAVEVPFPNPHTGGTSSNTVYVASSLREPVDA